MSHYRGEDPVSPVALCPLANVVSKHVGNGLSATGNYSVNAARPVLRQLLLKIFDLCVQLLDFDPQGLHIFASSVILAH